MINLLPPRSGLLIKKEVLRRAIVLAGSASAALLLAQILFSYATVYLTNSFWSSLTGQKILFEKTAQSKNLNVKENEAAGINALLTYFWQAAGQSPSVYGNIDEVLKVRPAGITINSFAFKNSVAGEPAEMEIRGRAQTRDNLVTLVNNLNAVGFFGDVVSPPSNFLSEKNIDYSLAIKLKN